MGIRSKLRERARQGVARLQARLNPGHQPIFIDFPPKPKPRYGWGKAPHAGLYELINQRRSDYIALIKEFGQFKDGLSQIPTEPPIDETKPYWGNPYIGGFNAAALYCLPKLLGSRRYIEIGSGNSTKFVRQGIVDNGLATEIISIDPYPRADIDRICDEIVRRPLEDVDVSLFGTLESGDILMVDNSHRCFQNSDVTVVFLDILPSLKSGVVVYFDDIYLPYDYPEGWTDRYYSEQYLLAVLLLADAATRYQVMLPHIFVEQDAELSAAEASFWETIGISGRSGNGFWLKVV